jgi:TPR repeat protein
MQLGTYSQQLLHASDPIPLPSDTTEPVVNTFSKMWLWLPLTLVAVVVGVSTSMGTPNKPQDELDWLSQLANNGDAGAQLQLGLAYRDGRYGLTPDAKTGLYWLKQSAAGGNAYAEDAIGNAYFKGQGTAHDETLAEQWWRKAIKDGDRDARLHLATALIQRGQSQEADQLLM